MEKRITVIIPFVNEGIEVENTLKSLIEHSNNDIDIIVINDASDDNYDYTELGSKFSIKYIENKQRLGVASSRELGVSFCNTDYFLLLDAHMRFYGDEWIEAITKELNKDPRTLLCTQTRFLKKREDKVIDTCSFNALGAYINYYALFHFLEPEWAERSRYKPELIDKNETTLLIPCVLGATYACSKKYWQYIRGLEGLLSYGNDEVLISLKVWMEGGTCKLLKNIEIGHIYRDVPPYTHHLPHRIYNRLFISHLLLPVGLKKKAFAIDRIKNPESYFDSILLFYHSFESINELKANITNKFTKDFYYHERMNRGGNFSDEKFIKAKNKKLLNHMAYIIQNLNSKNGIGLLHGQTGILILLYHYARFSKNNLVLKIADKLLETIVNELSEDVPINFVNGLLGIGWSIEYLTFNKFIKGDPNDILSDFDKKIMVLNIYRITDYNLEYGLGGIIRYILSRLYSNKTRNEKGLFTDEFLHEVYVRAKYITENRIYNNCPETYVEYILYYEDKMTIEAPYIYDITLLPGWNKYSVSNKETNLNGIVGLDLEFILTCDLFKIKY